MAETIDVKGVIALLDSRQWVRNIKLFTTNLATNKGGKYIVIPRAIIAHQERTPTVTSTQPNTNAANKEHKQHNNFTRNIQLPNKTIITIHPILVKEIDGKKVI